MVRALHDVLFCFFPPVGPYVSLILSTQTKVAVLSVTL